MSILRHREAGPEEQSTGREPSEAKASLVETFDEAESAVRQRLHVLRGIHSWDGRHELSAHEEMLHRAWPEGRTGGDGHEHFQTAIHMSERRIKVHEWIDIADRLASIVLRMGLGLAAASVAIQHIVG